MSNTSNKNDDKSNHSTLNNNEQVFTGDNIKPLKPLTRKQAAFVKHLVDNPKASATQAVKATYNVTTDNSASQVATENLRKPQILAELAKHSGTAEFTLIEVMNYSKEHGRTGTKEGASYAAVAASTANSLLDRIHGKATQRIEQRTEAVVINIDLTGVDSAAS